MLLVGSKAFLSYTFLDFQEGSLCISLISTVTMIQYTAALQLEW
jgi:hypothetical protein